MCSFAFRDGRAFFRNRYVRTEAFLREQAAQRLLYRGAFSVGNPSGGLFFNPFDFSVKGIANTSILHWGGRTLALYEARARVPSLSYSVIFPNAYALPAACPGQHSAASQSLPP